MTSMMERKHIQSEMAMNLTLNLRFQLFRPFPLWMTGCCESPKMVCGEAWLRVAEQEKHQREVEVTENGKNDDTRRCEGLCHLIVVVKKDRSLQVGNCWQVLFNFKISNSQKRTVKKTHGISKTNRPKSLYGSAFLRAIGPITSVR